MKTCIHERIWQSKQKQFYDHVRLWTKKFTPKGSFKENIILKLQA